MKPLSDNEADDRLYAARQALGDEPGETKHADTALAVIRNAIELIRTALFKASNKT